MNFDSYWLEPGAVIPVDIKTTAALVTEIHRLRQALAQPEQEPIAWVYNGILHEFDPSEFATSEVKPLYTAPPCQTGSQCIGGKCPECESEWVGLTDEELKVLCDEWQILENWHRAMVNSMKAEREACAKVCDDWPNGRDDVCLIAAAIRARSEK